MATKKSGERGPDSRPSQRRGAGEAPRENPRFLPPLAGDAAVFTYVKAVTPTESRVLRASDNYQW